MEAIACDVLVIGSGAAGLTTAITAHHFGADVLVVEKASKFGGTIGRMAVGAGKPTRVAFGRRRLA
jgi:succinate dehydrogenase/fumarate reductase flavoprotein subunit